MEFNEKQYAEHLKKVTKTAIKLGFYQPYADSPHIFKHKDGGDKEFDFSAINPKFLKHLLSKECFEK